jgi:hypothetical protein
MSKKPRKSLDDALAQQFVYGENQDSSASEEPKPEAKQESSPSPSSSTKKPKESNLMDKLQTPSKEATVRFTVDMPESMHRKLSVLAAKTGKKKVEIVRVLLGEMLDEVNE